MSRLTKRYRICRWRLHNLVKQYQAWRWRRKIRRIYKDRTTSPLSELLDLDLPVVGEPVFQWQYTDCGPSLDEPPGLTEKQWEAVREYLSEPMCEITLEHCAAALEDIAKMEDDKT